MPKKIEKKENKKEDILEKLPQFHQKVISLFKVDPKLALELLRKVKDSLSCEVAYKKLSGNIWNSNYKDGTTCKVHAFRTTGGRISIQLIGKTGRIGNWLCLLDINSKIPQVNCFLSLNNNSEHDDDEFIEIAIERSLIQYREVFKELQEYLKKELEGLEEDGKKILVKINKIKLK